MNSNAQRPACPAMPAASSSNLPAPASPEVDDIDMEQDQDLEPDDLTWADHLRGAQRQVTQPGAISLVNLLSKPPPLDLISKQLKDSVQYKGVPNTPAPRQHHIDIKLQAIQRKIEVAMHMLVHQQEAPSQEVHCLEELAAILRSTWEDVHQQRRVLMAGKFAPKLDNRSDDTRNKLLSKEEEERISKSRSARQASFRPQTTWRSRSQPGAARPFPLQSSQFPSNNKPFHSKDKVKGKGKGSSSTSF